MTSGPFDPAPILRHNRDVAGTLKDGEKGGRLMEHQASRRDLLLTSLMAALPLGVTGAAASPLNPEQTIIKLPDALQWNTLPPFPPGSVDTCPLTGETTAPGLCYTLVRWHPGFMSAPHFYSTDRYCMVLSGTWWCNSGADFDPAACVPVGPAAMCAASP
jgi:hypothetical protein